MKSGADFTGGIVKYSRVKRELQLLLGDTSADCVTTMFDFYGLPDSFPERNNKTGSPQEKAERVGNAVTADIGDQRFRCYLSLHEFESLLFSSPHHIAERMNDRSKEKDLVAIQRSFKTPEEINDNPSTCPSRRITGIFPLYKKPLDGSVIAQKIGLGTMRNACPHFNDWLTGIESLS